MTTTATTALPVLAASTSTTLAESTDRSVYGQQVTLTATVMSGAPGTGSPTGRVIFYDGTAVLGAAPLNGSGIATFTPVGLGVAAHSITAVYDGQTDFLRSGSSAVSLAVAPDATHPVLRPRLARLPRKKGVMVSLIVSIASTAPGGGTPTGPVTFLI